MRLAGQTIIMSVCGQLDYDNVSLESRLLGNQEGARAYIISRCVDMQTMIMSVLKFVCKGTRREPIR